MPSDHQLPKRKLQYCWPTEMESGQRYKKRRTEHHGFAYHIKLLILYLIRAYGMGGKFQLGADIKNFGIFDDLVYITTDALGQTKYQCVQAKHGYYSSKRITIWDLCNEGPLHVEKYFKSHLDINRKLLFESNSLKEYVICTNKLFDSNIFIVSPGFEPTIQLIEVSVQDTIFDSAILSNSNLKCYKITSLCKEMKEKFLCHTDFNQLVRLFVDYVMGQKSIDFTSDVLQRYLPALYNNRIIAFNKFHDDFVNNVDLSCNAAAFREAFKEMVRTHLWKNAKLSYVDTEFEAKFKICIKERMINVPVVFTTNVKMPILPAEELSAFFEVFTFAVGQPDEMQLHEIISQELRKKFNLKDDDFVIHHLQQIILNWMKKWDSPPFASQEDIHELLETVAIKLENIQLTYLKVEYKYCLRKSGRICKKLPLLDDFLNSTDTVLDLQTDNTRLTSLKVFDYLRNKDPYKEEDSYVHIKLNYMLQSEELVKNALNCSHDLLVVECDSNLEPAVTMRILKKLFDVVSNAKEKKVVFIGMKNADWRIAFLNGLNVSSIKKDDTTDFSNIPKEMQEKIENQKINFQGHNIPLKQIIQASELSAPLLSAIYLRVIENKEIKMGNAIARLGALKEEDYIKRTLIHKTVMKNEFLQVQWKSKDLFLIYGEAEAFTEFSHKTRVNLESIGSPADNVIEEVSRPLTSITYSKTSEKSALEKFSNLVVMFENDNIHLIQVFAGKLILQRSKGSLSKLYKYIDKKSPQFHKEEECILNETRQNVKLLIAVSGMGKSFSLANISFMIKERCPDCWVTVINLPAVQNFLTKMTVFDEEAVLNFILECENLKDEYEKQFLKLCFTLKQGVILFDAFDEIGEEDQCKVLDILKKLIVIGVRQLWVTSRLHLQRRLEEELAVISYEMKPLSKNQQVMVLQKYWSLKLGYHLEKPKLIRFVKVVVEHFSKVTEDQLSRFLEIPLHLKMIAQVLQKKCKKFCQLAKTEDPKDLLNNLFRSLFDLFTEVISLKSNEYNLKACTDNTKYQKNMADSHKENMYEMYRGYAFSLLFAKKYKEVGSHIEFNLGQMIDFGLIQKRGEFIHQTYAEYFTAWYAAHFLVKECRTTTFYEPLHKFLKSEMFKESNKLFRIFFDGHLNDQLLKMAKNATCKQQRKALHLAAAYNQTKVIKKLLEIGTEIEYVDRLLSWTALQYAVSNASWSASSFLVNKGAKLDVLNNIEKKQLLWYCCKIKKDDSVKQVCEKNLNDSVSSVKKLLQDCKNNNERNDLIVSNSESGFNALHYSAESGNAECITALLNEQKANEAELRKAILSQSNTFGKKCGKNVLHCAACNGSIDFLTALLDAVIDYPDLLKDFVVSSSESGWNALHYAAIAGNTEFGVAMLARVKGAVPDHFSDLVLSSSKNKGGMSALQYAAMSGYAEFLKAILDTVKQNKVLFTGLLFENSKLHMNALDFAAFEGAEECIYTILEEVNSVSVDPDFVKGLFHSFDKIHKNALHFAACEGGVECVNAILETVGRNNINILQDLVLSKSEECMNPLHYAALSVGPETGIAILDTVRNDPDVLMNLVTDTCDEGMNAFHYAIEADNLYLVIEILMTVSSNCDILKKLVFSANPNNNMNGLHYAAKNGNAVSVRAILDTVKDHMPDELISLIDSEDIDGYNALHYANEEGNMECANAILENMEN